MPPSARSRSTSSSPREKVAPSAVACTSTRRPAPVITTFMSDSAPRVLDVGQVEQRHAVHHAHADRGDRVAQRQRRDGLAARPARSSPGAAPPRRRRCWRSGCRRRPGARRSRATRCARRAPPCRPPPAASARSGAGSRWCARRGARGSRRGPSGRRWRPGSIPYSAVTQPRPRPRIHGGTASSTEAVQITRVRPTEIRALPWAVSTKPGRISIGLSSSGRRPSARTRAD